MIKLRLQQFVKTSSQTSAYRSRKSILKMSMPGQTSKVDKSFMKGRIDGDSISSRKNYIIFEVKDANDRNERNPKKASGATLRDAIAHETLRYNRRKRVWISKNKKVFIIRER